LEATDCLVQGSHQMGVYVEDSTATIDLVRILDTQTNTAGEGGRGIDAWNSSLVATDCLVQANHGIGLMLHESDATLEGVQILETRRDTIGSTAFGLVSQLNATVVATGLEVRDTAGPALYVIVDALLDCTDCSLTDNAFAGAVVQAGGNLVLRESLIEGTASGGNTGAGQGVFVSDLGWDAIVDGRQLGLPTFSMLASSIRDNEMGAVYIKGAGAYQLTGNSLSGGPGLDLESGPWPHGDAVFVTAGDKVPAAWDEEEQVGLLLEGNTFSDSAGAGIFLDGASATLSDNTYEGNNSDLIRQSCGEAEAPDGLDDEPLSTTELCPEYDYLTRDVVLMAYLVESEAEL
ncbi:MAG: right-handed parallel beta-helix repeat-containing protein, partial [Myxococcota bacterium]|nr:right-handed parallel beta-helix repeat-containing protein [Myxococcota bacterium]